MAPEDKARTYSWKPQGDQFQMKHLTGGYAEIKQDVIGGSEFLIIGGMQTEVGRSLGSQALGMGWD